MASKCAPTAYIAASWKHEHAVKMMTDLLREIGVEVRSFVENGYKEHSGAVFEPDGKKMDFDEWVLTDKGTRSFEFDVNGATTSDFVLYIGPSGTDAWAEVGAAWSAGVPVLGLWAKGEPAGLMRLMMMAWYTDHRQMLRHIKAVFVVRP